MATDVGDAAMTVTRPAADRAHESVSDLKERIERELPHWFHRASSITRSVLLVFSTTTALAAGFIAGIGIEFIALVDKWSIVGMVLFYTGVVLALLSPFLIIPHTFRAWERRKRWERIQEHLDEMHRNKKALAEKRRELEGARGRAEKTAEEIEKHDAAIGKAGTDLERIERDLGQLESRRRIDDRGWKRWRADPNADYKREKQKLVGARTTILDEIARQQRLRDGLTDDRQALEREIGEIETRVARIAAKKADIDQQIEPPPTVKRLLLCAFGCYVVVALLVLLNLFDGAWALGTMIVTALLCYAILYCRDLSLLGPSLTAYFVVIGYAIGISTFGYETNVDMEIKGQPHQVRILMATSNGFIVVKGNCIGRSGVGRFALPTAACSESAMRELAFLPKEAVGIVSVSRGDGVGARFSALKPFVWIQPYAASALGALTAKAQGRTDGSVKP